MKCLTHAGCVLYTGNVLSSDVKPLEVGSLNPLLNRVLISSPDQLVLVEDFFNRCSEFGFDIETNKVDVFWKRRVRTITVGDKNEQYVIDLLEFAGSSENLQNQGHFKTPEWFAPVKAVLIKGLDSRNHVKVGVNLEFDYSTCLWCLGLRSWNFWDCMMAEKVLYCGSVSFFQADFWGLDALVRRYMRLDINKELQTSFDLETPITSDQLDYCALDVRLPLGIKLAQTRLMEKNGLTMTAQVENNAIPAFGDLHINGFYLDAGEWTRVYEQQKAKHALNLEKLDAFFIPLVGDKNKLLVELEPISEAARQKWLDETADKELRRKYRDEYYAARRKVAELRKNWEKYEGNAAMCYKSPSQLLAALHNLGISKKKLPDTNDKTLARLAGEPVIDALRDYRETLKKLDMYGLSFLENIDEHTGRIHSDFSQLGAATGRTSSSKPNLQNIPSRGEDGRLYRACFKARPGKVLIIVDMAGAELRIIADMSGYKLWIDAFNNNEDVHSIGAKQMRPEDWTAGTEDGCAFESKRQKCKCKVHKEIRNDNKEVNFGVAYGMEDQGLADKLNKPRNYAKKLLGAWRQVNAHVQRFLDGLGDRAKKTLEARTAIGRRRSFKAVTWDDAKVKAQQWENEDAKKQKRDPRPVDTQAISKAYAMMFGNIEREGKNTPIQGGNADILKIAVGAGFDPDGKPFMWHQLADYNAEFVNTVHDEMVLECDPDKAEACVQMIGDCIKRAGKLCLKHVEMEYEAAINEVWVK